MQSALDMFMSMRYTNLRFIIIIIIIIIIICGTVDAPGRPASRPAAPHCPGVFFCKIKTRPSLPLHCHFVPG